MFHHHGGNIRCHSIERRGQLVGVITAWVTSDPALNGSHLIEFRLTLTWPWMFLDECVAVFNYTVSNYEPEISAPPALSRGLAVLSKIFHWVAATVLVPLGESRGLEQPFTSNLGN